MKIILYEENNNELISNKIVSFIISLIFKSMYINNEYFGLYALIAALIITILNKLIKPVLVIMTLPITVLTMGLSYPIVNVIILNLTSFIMGNNFNVSGFLTTFFASILISIFNIFMDGLIIKPLIKKD